MYDPVYRSTNKMRICLTPSSVYEKYNTRTSQLATRSIDDLIATVVLHCPTKIRVSLSLSQGLRCRQF